jgi:hypothetical protein
MWSLRATRHQNRTPARRDRSGPNPTRTPSSLAFIFIIVFGFSLSVASLLRRNSTELSTIRNMITRSQSHRHDNPTINTIDIPDQEDTSINTTNNDETTITTVPLPTRYSRRLLLSRTQLSPNTCAFYPARQHLLSAQALPFYPPAIPYDDTAFYSQHHQYTQPTLELCHHRDTGINNGNDSLRNQVRDNTDILFNTRHFYPPHPQGTYYEHGLLRSLTPDNQQQQNTSAISTRRTKDFPYHGNHCFITQNVNGMMYDDLKIKSYITK